MKKSKELNVKIILTGLVAALVLILPVVIFTVKLNIAKPALRIDPKRYEEVNYVCFEEKLPDGCLAFLKEDVDILTEAHKENLKFAKQDASIKDPEGFIRIFYNRFENRQGVEPEILLKTMMIKRILFRDLKNPVEAGLFNAQMKDYIHDNFSEPNRSRGLNMLEAQDKVFEEALKKL